MSSSKSSLADKDESKFKGLPYSILFIILVVLLITSCSSSDEPAVVQGIQGSVMDEAGNPYPNVQLTLQPGNVQSTSNNDGNYSFNNLSPGSYDVSIKPPKSSEVPSGNSSSVTVNAGQSQNLNFTLRMLPLAASLVLDTTDPIGEVRGAQGNVPSDPAELIYKSFGSNLFPIEAPDGHHLTLQDWSSAQGTSRVTCNGTTTNYDIELSGLIPNGVYTIWNQIYATSKEPGDGIDDNIAGGPLGPSNGSQNVFNASASGTAAVNIGVSGGADLAFGGQQPDCALSDAPGFILVVLYHLDGQTYGESPGPEDTTVAHLLMFY